MLYKELFERENLNVLITGDSLSFNRYGYDNEGRFEACFYGAGMKSWSFRLRDRIFKTDPQFTFAENLTFNCETLNGLDNKSDIPNTEIFDGKVRTLLPETDVEFNVNIKSKQIVLYLQKRIDCPVTFDIYVDGKLALEKVDTLGAMDDFAGYGLHILKLNCDQNAENHLIEFKNIEGRNKKITVAAVGSVYRKVVLNGKGSQCVSFFLENFEERIGRHNPDIAVLILSANDRIFIAPEVLRKHLVELFARIFETNPNCKILFLLPPNAHRKEAPYTDGWGGSYSSLDTCKVYNKVICDVCENLGKPLYDGFNLSADKNYDIDVFSIPDLFDDNDISRWRIDNIHMTNWGNDRVYDALCEKLGL